MMSEEEDCDELPAISVNSTTRELVSFMMPTAEELASQRARELETERELRLLRERHAADEQPAPAPAPAPAPGALAHCDSAGSSSGSEGEAALAAAVSALRVRPPPAHRAPPARRLLDALARATPLAVAHELRHHAAALAEPDERLVAAHLDELVSGVGSLLAGAGSGSGSGRDETWSDEDTLCAAALLAVALAARETHGRRPAARAMHRLLDDIATPEQVCAILRVLREAVPERRVRLALSDALRDGGGGGAEQLADSLLHAALADLLDAPPQECLFLSEAQLGELAGGAWRRLEAEPRSVLLQLLGRALAAAPRADPEARARLLAALAPPARHHGAAHHPDKLEVLVGASKLRLLFRSGN